MGKGKNIAYVRVSTVEQNEARQREALKTFNIDKWFVEKASGKDAKRPVLQEMLEYIREDDTVYVEEFSRLGRSTADLLATVQRIEDSGVSRRQEIGMLQAIGLSKKQLIKMLCYEGLMYSVFATLVTLVLGTGLGFLSVQVVVKTMNPYFYYSFPWLIVLIYLAILLIVQFTLISYTTGNLKKQSLVEQIRTME